ncbi:MAG TPA: hypothetical protein VJ891_01875 [Casimicrobiaceae bacterium]|nr:hypothetical protein [Casimicrobiaceae bacterium]
MPKNKKTDAFNTANQSIAELAEQAQRLEAAGNWGDAAQVWQRIASHKNSSKKARTEAKGRAAAARVRAEAKGSKATEEVIEQNTTPPQNGDDARANAPEETTSVEEPPANVAPESIEEAPKESVAPEAPAPKKTRTPSDATLPEIGTLIQKRDRKGLVRAECKVVEGGIEYKGTTYGSLSAAALAASKDLGLGAKTLDGWAWWGLKTRESSPAKKDLGETLERAFSKYRERVASLIKASAGDDLVKIGNTLKAQATELATMVEPSETPAA